MKQCLGCQGLVPEAFEACPNCAVERRSSFKKLMAAASMVAIVASGCIATPVYGAPCTSLQIDGGNDGCPGGCTTRLADGGAPARDPMNSCYQADGGTP